MILRKISEVEPPFYFSCAKNKMDHKDALLEKEQEDPREL